MKTPLFIVIMFINCLAQAEVYRCLNEQSEITFIDTPCHTDSQPYKTKQSMALKLKNVDAPIVQRKKATPTAKKASQSASCQRFSATQLRNLRVKDLFKKGMPASAISKRFGKVKQVKHKPNNKQSWVYKSTHVKRTFNFKDNCLVSWQEKWKGKKSKLSKYQN